ncbi:MAG TPA: glycosyltransferase family 2 protein [Bauldia sp.]|nr:glycosyltransferase family 2 protein [Bauldia sp.]
MTVAKVGGVCVLRDAGDIVGLLCGHYLRMGLARVAVVDDGSTDGTFEFLSALSQREPRVLVRRVLRDTFDQPELMTDLANSLIREGYRLIIPFDADEFWNVSALALKERYRGRPDICFSGRVVNFVQWRSRIQPTPWGLLDIRYRAPSLVNADRQSISAFKYPFVCIGYRKIGFKTSREVDIGRGQHHLLSGPNEMDEYEHEIFHIPLRQKSELAKRALNYEPRRASRRLSEDESWQSRFFREAMLAGREDELWSLNSADRHGALNSDQGTIQLISDRRLQFTLLASWAYMMTHHGGLMWRQQTSMRQRPNQPKKSSSQP